MNNDIIYWNKKFKSGQWTKNNGEKQTIFWSNLIFDNLPKNIIDDVRKNSLNIVDIGTAFGQLCEIASSLFPNSKIKGYDFSIEAINKCKELYPNLSKVEFINGRLEEKTDTILLSNVLEHIDNWLEELIYHINLANKYVIILSPFEENPEDLIEEHVVSFNKTSFVEEINGFKKTFEKIIDVTDSTFWTGNMILCVYTKQ